ncbi:MAG TPA: hypothetical protein PLF26_13540 [Blastocatellia bacterium]|nr:hypothetical protein [Blastocatellia bacterium]
MALKKRLIRVSNRVLVWIGLLGKQRLALDLANRLGKRIKLDPRLNKRQLRNNLRKFFPDADQAWIETTARELQDNSLRARQFDKYFLPKLATEELDKIVEMVDWHVAESVIESGRGIIIASMHFGRFWAVPLWFSRHGYQSAAFQSSEGRLPSEADTLSAGSLNANDPRSTLRAVKLLKKGAVVFLILDAGKIQNPLVLDFLGQPTHVSPAAVRLAKVSDAVIIPLLAHIDPNDPERIVPRFEEPIDPRTIPDDEPVETTMLRVLAPLEAHARRTPSQWYGFLNAHRRLARNHSDDDI